MHTQQRTFPRGHSLDKSIVKGCMQRTRGLACILLGGVRGMGSLARAIAGDAADTSVPVTAAYIHLPFCKRKCFYCDFPVEALGRNIATQYAQNRIKSYVDVVCSEINANQTFGNLPLQTISFGGGTPSLVPPDLLADLLSALDRRFGIAADAEVSLEADPATFDAPRLRAYKALGVNRLSVGVQAFDEDLLLKCGRSHTLADAHAAIEAVHAVGMASWSLDLISGLPGLSHDQWAHSLEKAVEAGPHHVSVYDLQVEQGTPFGRWYPAGSTQLPQEGDSAAMYAHASATLRGAGYEHYEVSNYARPGHRSRHNQVYWQGAPFYAFGVGAASYLAGRRFSRPRGLKKYMAWVEELRARGPGVPGVELPPESKEDRLLDTIMLRLRMSDGLDVGWLRSEFGDDAARRVVAALGRRVGEGLTQFLTTGAANDAGRGGHEGAPTDLHSSRLPWVAAGPQGGDAQGMVVMGRADIEQLLRGLSGASFAGLASSGGCDAEGGVRVRLTDPGGFLMSNDVISDVFAAMSDLG